MVRSISRFVAVAIALLVMSRASTAHADTFVAVSGKDRMTLTCEGPAVVDTQCNIAVGQGSAGQAIRFTAKPTRYAHLLKVGVEKAAQNPALAALDLAVLRGLDLGKCHPDAEYFGDLFQLCVSPGSASTVVLFMRGLCDRCDFEPVVLRKQ